LYVRQRQKRSREVDQRPLVLCVAGRHGVEHGTRGMRSIFVGLVHGNSSISGERAAPGIVPTNGPSEREFSASTARLLRRKIDDR
jgi:hypothetical protein